MEDRKRNSWRIVLRYPLGRRKMLASASDEKESIVHFSFTANKALRKETHKHRPEVQGQGRVRHEAKGVWALQSI